MADESGDAQWPHYSPTGAGANLPQFDFTKLEVGQPNASTLRMKMTLSSLASLTPPAGKTQSLWLTRFQALSTGNSGEESYRIFYVGAQVDRRADAELLRRLDHLHGVDAGTCKVTNYPATTPVQGKVCGNALVVDVPLSGFGNPIQRRVALQRDRPLGRAERGQRPVRGRRRDAHVRLRARQRQGAVELLSHLARKGAGSGRLPSRAYGP